MDGRMDGRMGGRTDGGTDGWTSGWIKGWMEGLPLSLSFVCRSSITHSSTHRLIFIELRMVDYFSGHSLVVLFHR